MNQDRTLLSATRFNNADIEADVKKSAWLPVHAQI